MELLWNCFIIDSLKLFEFDYISTKGILKVQSSFLEILVNFCRKSQKRKVKNRLEIIWNINFTKTCKKRKSR